MEGESGGTIINQLKRLGASCDWSRERFTMDEGLSRAVVKVFVELYRQGLIYKDKRLVNWDPKLLTAVSDLEVQQTEVKGNLWYLRYPLEGCAFSPDDPASFIVVATTRPETMLGDTAVAVHPDDERYKHLIGKHVILPLVGRKIPIVGDDYSDPEKGSGAVKVTPAHDFNDFEIGRRHGLPQINIFDEEACLTLVGNENYLRNLPEGAIHFAEEFQGVERFAARKRLVARLEDFGFLERIEPNTHMVPHGDRSGAILEPYLTDQWFVDAKTLAKPAIEAVRVGPHGVRPEELGEDLFRVDGEHPALVHLAPALVGPPDPGLVWSGRQGLRRRDRGRGGRHALGYYVEQEVITSSRAGDGATATSATVSSPATRTCSIPGSPLRCGRSRRLAGPTTRRR